MRFSLTFLACIAAAAPALRAQDLARYRAFSLGSNLAAVLKHTDQKLQDVKLIMNSPVPLQELTWWPPGLPGTPYRADTVEQIHFSFWNAELYKISVTYDRGSTEGLTREDMVRSLSAKYGAPATLAPVGDAAAREGYDSQQEPIAWWQDSQYSVRLSGSSFSGAFDLLILSKRLSEKAELALAEAATVDKQQAPQREADRRKKEMDDLELARQKNQKNFRP